VEKYRATKEIRAKEFGSLEWFREELAARGITKITEEQYENIVKNIDSIADTLRNAKE